MVWTHFVDSARKQKTWIPKLRLLLFRLSQLLILNEPRKRKLSSFKKKIWQISAHLLPFSHASHSWIIFSNPSKQTVFLGFGAQIEATEYHVHLESWQVYPVDWTFIQRTYTSMAPKNLGSSGYQGLSTAYLPKPARQQAYASSGTAIEFYRNWNISWNQPWIYFGNISGVDSTLLMLCTESVMSDDGAMRRHVQFTGDADGVVITNVAWQVREKISRFHRSSPVSLFLFVGSQTLRVLSNQIRCLLSIAALSCVVCCLSTRGRQHHLESRVHINSTHNEKILSPDL